MATSDVLSGGDGPFAARVREQLGGMPSMEGLLASPRPLPPAIARTTTMRRCSRRQELRELNYEILAKHYPDFTLHRNEDGEFFEGWYNTHAGKAYQLRLVIPPGFPDEEPDLIVWHPSRLTTFDGREMPSCSHDFHTSLRAGGRRTTLCHVPDWDASHTLGGVLIRGFMWLEALELHLKNGKHVIADYFVEE